MKLTIKGYQYGSQSINIVIGIIFFVFLGCVNAFGQVSFWNNSTAPSSPDTTGDTASLTLGLQFYSDAPGLITGVRFFKGTQNTGQHVGILWSSTGTKLAQVTFSGETASGWQQANFAKAVSISANTHYVISYFAPKGNYAVDVNYSWSTLSSPPLHPAGSAAGVYAYGSNPAFPTGVHNACNYWVDAVFVANTPPPPVTSTVSFWSSTAMPLTPDFTADSSALTLGLQFSSDITGSITGVRFYKGSNNSGPHVATLWSSTGSKLAEMTVSGETASGWQQATFSAPVSILAKTTYVVSYFAPYGNYAFDPSYSWSGLNATPLHVVGSSPGVYAYGSGSSFPQQTNNGGNYWVDPVFSATSAPPPVSYSISGTVTGTAATLTVSGAVGQSTTTDSAGHYTFTGLPNGSYVVAPSQPGDTFSPGTALVAINGAAVTGINFTGATAPHNATISWSPSNSANILGYNVYRATSSGGPYAKLTTAPISGTGYVDNGVTAGQTYYYAATALDTSNHESIYSNVGVVTIP
jgi:hypothetical protein